MTITRRLLVSHGRSEREIALLGPIVIGRDPACQVSDPDPLLSRRHAVIAPAAEGACVRDLDSRNGVLVNGERTREQLLRSGDVVQLGHLRIRYLEERVAPQQPGSPEEPVSPQEPISPEEPVSRPVPADELRGRAAFDAVVERPVVASSSVADADVAGASPATGDEARAVANAELHVIEVTPRCAELLGVPAAALVGTSLPDLFVRSVRRAYADPDATLAMTIGHGPRGSIVVTFSQQRRT